MSQLGRLTFTIAAAAVLMACSMSSLGLPDLLATATPAPSPTVPAPAATGLPTATDTPVIATATEPLPTFTAIPTFTSGPATGGLPIEYGNVSLTIPDGLASGTTNTTSTDVEFPFVNPSGGDMPEHTKIVLTGYVVQGTLLAPQVMVFPAEPYSRYSDFTSKVISTLQTMQFYDGQPLPDGLPDGPYNAHVHSVAFANGKGIAYLTQFNQAVAPANNRDLIYYFHGLSSDGAHYVQVILPVQAASLPADDNMDQPVPPGGIEFDTDHLTEYFTSVSNQLNATPPGKFMPPLTTLDALVQSIRVK